jgi:hypothetical protein
MGLKIMIIRIGCAMRDAMRGRRIIIYRTGIDLSSEYIPGHFFERGPMLSPP